MADLDFIGFTYGDKHSVRDLGIYRTSDGSRFNINLIPSLTDKAIDVPEGDGQYFFGSQHKNRQFVINFAFDDLTETQISTLRKTFDGKDIKELIFDELPFKAYSAKVTGTPQIKTIPFSVMENGVVKRVYKGEGSVTFTCFYPYAHTPDWYWKKTSNSYEKSKKLDNGSEFDGRYPYHYLGKSIDINSSFDLNTTAYPTYNEWKESLHASAASVNYYVNRGELSTPFIAKIKGGRTEVEIHGHTITLKESLNSSKPWFWDSRLGLIYITEDDNYDSKKIPIAYEGNANVFLPLGAIEEARSPAGYGLDFLKFQYWFY